mmetsp:Transcript_41682/g.134773  ORF Transcript_41682/g.134773 Transcript_41682/m.134773 type:complete len:811 (+) Transcript_41682:121-2553(+)
MTGQDKHVLLVESAEPQQQGGEAADLCLDGDRVAERGLPRRQHGAHRYAAVAVVLGLTAWAGSAAHEMVMERARVPSAAAAPVPVPSAALVEDVVGLAATTWKDLPKDVNPGGFMEAHIHLAHDRNICVQPTHGMADGWVCHNYQEGEGDAWCRAQAHIFDLGEHRLGSEVRYFDFTSPCGDGCHCCERGIHGRPEPGGGLHVRLWPCQQGSVRQRFLLPKSGKGPIRLAEFPNRCLTVSGGSEDSHLIMLSVCAENKWQGQIWQLPEDGQGPIRLAGDSNTCLDGGRVNKGDAMEAKLQAWHCEANSVRTSNQLFLMSHLPKDEPEPSEDGICNEEGWAGSMGTSCGKCQTTVALSDAGHRNCFDFCASVGRQCASTYMSTDKCVKSGEATCASQFRNSHAVCECGKKFMRGNYGSLAEFWVEPSLISQRVHEMSDKFGIKEFAFEYAFEGFSKPPAETKAQWECRIQGRPVKRATLKAAIAAIGEVGGRSWLTVHASAIDRGDTEMLAGQWTMPPEDVAKKLSSQYFEVVQARKRMLRQSNSTRTPARSLIDERPLDSTYEQTYEEMCGCDVGNYNVEPTQDPAGRIMDVVSPGPGWAVQIAPGWAKFAKGLGFSGIHWLTLGDFGHWQKDEFPKNPFGNAAPLPDISGFLRASLPILKRQGLEQTMNFVDGYGWDASLLDSSAGDFTAPWINAGGRAVAFPYWEVWTEDRLEALYKTVGEKEEFVMAMYPGYSKYHCCAANERQNAKEYGVWPFDLGIKRWRDSAAHGGTYHLVIDGLRYLQGPFMPDAVRMSEAEVDKLSDVTKQL